jgi:DNA-binding transcriptional LysR family regulator
MIDLNDLRVFEKVGSLGSFTAASRSLGVPKSSVSRGVARLEHELGVRLLQRTTRQVVLTGEGVALLERCADLLARLRDGLDHVGSISGPPKGVLKISAGIGFGVHVLSRLLPDFLGRYPEVRVNLDLTSKLSDPIAGGMDVAIRMGPLPDSGLKCVSLGNIPRRLCAAPAYLKRRGKPRKIADIAGHDTLEMPRGDGRPREWVFERGGKSERVELQPRVTVNDVLTIHRLVQNGVGLGIVSGYLADPDIRGGTLVHLFPDWVAPPVAVNLLFPTDRELAPAVRAFITFMRRASGPTALWVKSIV